MEEKQKEGLTFLLVIGGLIAAAVLLINKKKAEEAIDIKQSGADAIDGGKEPTTIKLGGDDKKDLTEGNGRPLGRVAVSLAPPPQNLEKAYAKTFLFNGGDVRGKYVWAKYRCNLYSDIENKIKFDIPERMVADHGSAIQGDLIGRSMGLDSTGNWIQVMRMDKQNIVFIPSGMSEIGVMPTQE